MNNYLPLIAFLLIIAAFVAYGARARRKQAALEQQRAEQIGVGTDVMTTSGLHGTVVAVNGDGTVALSIAPGVEVRWEVAALRDVASLPEQFRHGADALGEVAGEEPGAAHGTADRVELGKRAEVRHDDVRGTDPAG